MSEDPFTYGPARVLIATQDSIIDNALGRNESPWIDLGNTGLASSGSGPGSGVWVDDDGEQA